MGTISSRSRYSIINTFRVYRELIELNRMFTIEKPKEIHIQSWKEIINQTPPSHTFQFDNINFDMFWSNIFQDNFFAFAAKMKINLWALLLGE